MGFHEVRFPTDISYRSAGGPGHYTDIIRMDSGAEEAVSRWSSPIRKFNAAYGVKSFTDLAALRDFYIARLGCGNGFRFRDFLDCSSSSNGLATELGGAAVVDDDVEIGTGDGTETAFQLKKFYVSGSQTRTRNITKPVSGTTVIAVNGISQPSGWSVDTTTGIVTFSVAPTNAHPITAGFEFDVPVRFGKEVDTELSMSIDDFGHGSALNIPLMEIIDGLAQPDEYFYGGATDFTVTANFTIGLSHGRVMVISSMDAARDCILPSTSGLATGGPLFYVFNNDGTYTLTIKEHADDGSSTVCTLAAGESCVLVLGLVGAAKTWLAT